MAAPRKYEVEIWYRGLVKLGEIGRLLNSLSWTETRNGVGSINFNIDNAILIDYCARIGTDPAEFIQLINTDIKIKRNGEYRMGGFLADMPEPNFNQDNTTQNFTADGYLNLLADQRIQTPNYSQVETTDIAWDLIADNNTREYSTLGITKSATQWFTTGVNRDRTYDNDQMVADNLVKLTALGDGSKDFDFRFSPFRELQTFDANNPTVWRDVIIEYPAPRKGIMATTMGVSVAAAVANDILAKGSGEGTATLIATAADISSKFQYGNHDRNITYSDVSILDTLQQYSDANLALYKQPIFLPKVNVNGAQFNVSQIHAGDVVRVRNNKIPWFKTDGFYRIEEMSVNVTDNGSEGVDITLSNVGLPEIPEN